MVAAHVHKCRSGSMSSFSVLGCQKNNILHHRELRNARTDGRETHFCCNLHADSSETAYYFVLGAGDTSNFLRVPGIGKRSLRKVVQLLIDSFLSPAKEKWQMTESLLVTWRPRHPARQYVSTMRVRNERERVTSS